MLIKKFNIVLLLTLLGDIQLFAQEFDRDFLDSLPKDVQTQLLSEVNSEEEQRKKRNLKAPSSAINIEQKDSTSEKFGVNFFNTLQTSFMPINEPIFDPDYILGYGDQLELQFAGQKNDSINVTVSRDGSINLPEIGKVIVAGLSLERVDQLLQQRVKQAFIGVELFTTLKTIRDMQILIVGEVAYPGVYTIPGNASLLNILAAAGGFTDNASLRTLQIKRHGKIISTLDLYQAFVYGDFSKINTPLRAGDTIFISPAIYEVRIQGGVRRSGIYELLPDEGYKELLSFANGYTNTAKVNEIQLSRVENQTVNYIIYNNEELGSISIRHEDVITVQTIETLEVSIDGAVQRPGNYLLPEGSSLIDLIQISGGYKEDAYPFGGIYLNEVAAEKENLSNELIRKDLISFLATNSSAKSSEDDNVDLLLNEFSSLQPSGRVSIDFGINNLRSEDLNFSLSNKDRIIIPTFQNIVHVYGDVENPGSFKFETTKDAMHYLKLAGSVKKNASKKIILYHPNGESEVLDKSRGFSFASTDTLIYPGTLIFVPRDFSLTGIESAQLYLPIVSNLALTMASIASISNSTK